MNANDPKQQDTRSTTVTAEGGSYRRGSQEQSGTFGTFAQLKNGDSAAAVKQQNALSDQNKPAGTLGTFFNNLTGKK